MKSKNKVDSYNQRNVGDFFIWKNNKLSDLQMFFRIYLIFAWLFLGINLNEIKKKNSWCHSDRSFEQNDISNMLIGLMID